jgi:hypothetical protein
MPPDFYILIQFLRQKMQLIYINGFCHSMLGWLRRPNITQQLMGSDVITSSMGPIT